MSNNCRKCGLRVMFGVWSTSRDLDIEFRVDPKENAYFICYQCLKDLRK